MGTKKQSKITPSLEKATIYFETYIHIHQTITECLLRSGAVVSLAGNMKDSKDLQRELTKA